MPTHMKKIFFRLFSTSAAGLYMILFALAIGVATFIENDFGTSAAAIHFLLKWRASFRTQCSGVRKLLLTGMFKTNE